MDNFCSERPEQDSPINHYRNTNIIAQALPEQQKQVFMALNETERRVLLAFPLDIKGDVAFIVDKLQNSLSEETSYSVWGKERKTCEEYNINYSCYFCFQVPS